MLFESFEVGAGTDVAVEVYPDMEADGDRRSQLGGNNSATYLEVDRPSMPLLIEKKVTGSVIVLEYVCT